MSVTTTSASATTTTDKIIVEKALDACAIACVLQQQDDKLHTAGWSAMDTGTTPPSDFVSLYAIYNTTMPIATLLATSAATRHDNVYGGANRHAGYPPLSGVWLTEMAAPCEHSRP